MVNIYTDINDNSIHTYEDVSKNDNVSIIYDYNSNEFKTVYSYGDYLKEEI